MVFSLFDVVLLLALGGLAGWFLTGMRVRELALQAARRACEREGVQLLDQTVSSKRVSLSRVGSGQWRVWRQYHFEYTYDGNQRQAGHVIMLGGRLQALVMAERPEILH
jgi:hypothetical protein